MMGLVREGTESVPLLGGWSLLNWERHRPQTPLNFLTS